MPGRTPLKRPALRSAKRRVLVGVEATRRAVVTGVQTFGKDMERGEAGVFTVPVSDVLDELEEAWANR